MAGAYLATPRQDNLLNDPDITDEEEVDEDDLDAPAGPSSRALDVREDDNDDIALSGKAAKFAARIVKKPQEPFLHKDREAARQAQEEGTFMHVVPVASAEDSEYLNLSDGSRRLKINLGSYITKEEKVDKEGRPR